MRARDLPPGERDRALLDRWVLTFWKLFFWLIIILVLGGLAGLVR